MRTRVSGSRAPDAAVQGIGDLLSTYARCCKPVPPEPIVGYITVGRGVSIHSQSCANLARLSLKAPARVLAVDWGRLGSNEFPVDIEVQAFDRRGLVRDVSAALADEKISIQGMTTVTDKQENVAHMRIGITIYRTAAADQGPGTHRAVAECHQRKTEEIEPTGFALGTPVTSPRARRCKGWRRFLFSAVPALFT